MSDAEWHFVMPDLRPLPEDAGQRVHDLRDVFEALRGMARSGSPWCYLPKDLPPWAAVYQQARRRIDAGCFEAIVHDLRAVLRCADGRGPEPTAAILDSRTIQATPESGARAGYDGYKRRKGSRVHVAADTLGHMLALHITPANEQDRAGSPRSARRCRRSRASRQGWRSSPSAKPATGRTGHAVSSASTWRYMKRSEAKRGFVLLPRRWVVERSSGWMARFRRLARDYERLSTTPAGLHYVAFGMLLPRKAAPLLAWSS